MIYGGGGQFKLHGFNILKLFKKSKLNIRSLVYSSLDSNGIIVRALHPDNDIYGFVSKNSDSQTLLDALDTIAKGKRFIQQNTFLRFTNTQAKINILSKREQELVTYIFDHHTNEEISEYMGISKRSVENYLCHIYDKTGTNNKQQLLEFLSN